MARFIGSVRGNRGEASRLGTPQSGLSAHAQGWDIGASAYVYVNSKGEDLVRVSINRGSNGHGGDLFLGVFKIKDGGIVNASEE